VYPRLSEDTAGQLAATFDSGDSAFVFGSVTRSEATVTVNGVAAAVAATGGWLAWLPLPADTLAVIEVRAAIPTDTSRVTFVARLPRRFVPPDSGLWVDTAALEPRGVVWTRPGEGIPLRVRATPGARLRLLLPDSTAVPFVADSVELALTWGERAFGTVAPAPRAAETGYYRAWWIGPLGDPGFILGDAGAAGERDGTIAGRRAGGRAGGDTAAAMSDTHACRCPVLETVLDSAVLRIPWPLRVGVVDPAHPVVAVVNDDTAGTGTTDRQLPGRPAPWGTYHWFFPNGTRAVVSGRWNDQVRLQLSQRTVAWVDAVDVQPLAAGTPPLTGTTQPLRLYPGARSLVLRVPLPGRIPFRVDEDDSRLALTLYGVAANADWVQYGPADSLARRLAFEAPAEDEVRIVVDLARPVWGYRTTWAGTDLLLEIRRPPALNRRRPLDGLLVALDPGHPPAGARGPTGAYEGDVVLEVARQAKRLFERAGARVLLVRDDTLPLGLVERTAAAEAADADLLISVHANALPDGVNPRTNSGTSTYYYHPRAAEFARQVNAAMVRRFGSRDLGIGRGDLALTRPTWMPAILTEGLFMMVPEQEALLISADGQRRYAEALVEGSAAFLATQVR
jgi:N-acetylmuramoyl-L-alanine amidase